MVKFVIIKEFFLRYIIVYELTLFTISGFEADKKLRQTAKNFMNFDISKRRDYVKTLLMTGKP